MLAKGEMVILLSCAELSAVAVIMIAVKLSPESNVLGPASSFSGRRTSDAGRRFCEANAKKYKEHRRSFKKGVRSAHPRACPVRSNALTLIDCYDTGSPLRPNELLK